MNRRSDLIIAFVVALALHGLAGICAEGLFVRWFNTHQDIEPVFIEGFSSVEYTVAAPAEDPLPEEPVHTPVPEERLEPPVVDQEILPPPPAEMPAPAEELVVQAEIDTAMPDDLVHQPPIDMPAAVQQLQMAAAPQMPSDGNLLPKGVKESIVGLGEIRPRYPLGARMRGEEGVVSVDVFVDRNGRARSADISQSSGFPSLDRAAREAVLKARFIAKDGGELTGGRVTLSFRFKLVDQ